MHALIFLIVC